MLIVIALQKGFWIVTQIPGSGKMSFQKLARTNEQ